MERRHIYVLLLNAYLERLREPNGPFWQAEIEAHLHQPESGEELLVIACKYFRLDFPLTADGMLAARRAIDELAQLARGNVLGLGDELELHPERGYHLPTTEQALTVREGETDGQA